MNRASKQIIRAALIALSFACGTAAHAIGDSGGCGDWLGYPIGEAVTRGTPSEVERQLSLYVDKVERNLGVYEKTAHLFSRVANRGKARQVWRLEQIKNLIEGVHPKGAACVPGILLNAAVTAGNIEVVKYLLNKPLGVTPNIHSSVFDCYAYRNLSPERRVRLRESLAIVLDSGGIALVNPGPGHESSLLLNCGETELLTLFIKHGARIDADVGVIYAEHQYIKINVLESTILASIQKHGKDYLIERSKYFASAMSAPASIEGRPVEGKIRELCTKRKPLPKSEPAITRYENRQASLRNSCQQLASFIKSTPGTFGEGL